MRIIIVSILCSKFIKEHASKPRLILSKEIELIYIRSTTPELDLTPGLAGPFLRGFPCLTRIRERKAEMTMPIIVNQLHMCLGVYCTVYSWCKTLLLYILKLVDRYLE